MPSPVAESYRRNAEHALEMAKLARTNDTRDQWKKIAEGYLRLAESADWDGATPN